MLLLEKIQCIREKSKNNGKKNLIVKLKYDDKTQKDQKGIQD